MVYDFMRLLFDPKAMWNYFFSLVQWYCKKYSDMFCLSGFSSASPLVHTQWPSLSNWTEENPAISTLPSPSLSRQVNVVTPCSFSYFASMLQAPSGDISRRASTQFIVLTKRSVSEVGLPWRWRIFARTAWAWVSTGFCSGEHALRAMRPERTKKGFI